MSTQNLLVTEDLVTHMEKAFPETVYKPGMTLDEVAYRQGTQDPINHLKYLLRKRNQRGR